jgi:hypothetical protein
VGEYRQLGDESRGRGALWEHLPHTWLVRLGGYPASTMQASTDFGQQELAEDQMIS